MNPADRILRLLTGVLSLRIIVIVAALSVVALVIALGAWVWFGVNSDQYSQLDRRLDSVSSLGDISTLLRTAQSDGTDAPAPDGGLVRTARIGGTTVSMPREIVLPQFDIGYANTTIDGVEYRVRTFAAGDATIAVGAPVAETQRRIDELHRRVLLSSSEPSWSGG
jgi:two-component system sensor histidine kinase PrrB